MLEFGKALLGGMEELAIVAIPSTFDRWIGQLVQQRTRKNAARLQTLRRF